MSSRNKQTASGRAQRWIALSAAMLLFVCALTGMLFLQNRRLRKIQVYRPYVDSLFLPRVEMSRILSLGYDLFAADFLYMRSIQAFGGQWRFGMENYDSIIHLFNVMTALDPHFIDAYEFGSMIIGEEAENPKAGMTLNENGWYKNTHKYRLAYLNAYTALYVLDEPLLAKFWITQASKADDAPEFVNRFIQYIDQKMGRYESALEKNVFDYIEALRDNKDYLEAILKRKFQLVCEDWNLAVLHTALERYREAHDGALPAHVENLWTGGYMKDLRTCNYPRLKAITDNIQVPESADVQKLMRQVMDACVGPAAGIPHAPFAESLREDRYAIRVDLKPEEVDKFVEEKNAIVSMNGAKEYLRSQALPHVRRRIQQFHSQYKRYPFFLEELTADGKLDVVDPVLGEWHYSPITGQVLSPLFPRL